MSLRRCIPIRDRISYPVGERLGQNMKIIREMIIAINTLIKTPNLQIFCTGGSGGIIAGIMTAHLQKSYSVNIFHFNAQSHHREAFGRGVDFEDPDNSNIIVDDFVCTGTTIREILDVSRRRFPDIKFKALCVSGISRDGISEFKDDFEIIIGSPNNLTLQDVYSKTNQPIQ